MDTALVRPPSPTYTAITPVTRAPEQTEPAVSTDLAVEKTVRPSGESSGSQRSADNGQNHRQTREGDGRSAMERYTPSITRQNIVDPDSDNLVYVATNTDTGEVVRQIPSETLIRLRAYSETVKAQEAEADQKSVQTTV